jgi:NAD(P)-dependent dehydrogenase (short-subunit alcohol dehydrogenase family)
MSIAAALERRFGLAGRVALVTGASSGIGRAIAEGLAEAGAAVVLVGRRADTLATVEAAIRAAGGSAAFVVADLGRRSDVEKAATRAAGAFGAPDILVNVAGLNVRKPMDELVVSDWDEILAVNLTAAFLLGQALAPAMVARGWGRIINVTSQQAQRAFNHSGAYGVAKAGLAALTRSQSEAWSPHGVTANALCPGLIATPMTAAVLADPARAAALAARTHCGRNGVPADLVGAALFLASPAATYVTGASLAVDGGFSAT